MEFGIVIQGLTALLFRCKAAGADAQPLTDAAIAKSAFYLQTAIRLEAPHRTGNLQRSILIENGEHTAIVKSVEKYSIYVEKGTAAHDIMPVNKKALHWGGDPGFFAAVVHHPGTKANPFFQRGIDQSAPGINAIFNQVREQITLQLAGGKPT